MVIDELITLLTFDSRSSDIEKAEKYKEAIANIGEAATSAAKWISGIGAAIIAAGRVVAGRVAENYEWAKSNGVNFDMMQKMASVAEQFGGTVDDMKDSLAYWSRVSNGSLDTVADRWDNIFDAVKNQPAAIQKQAMEAAKIPEPYIRAYQQVGKARVREMLASAKVVSATEAKSSHQFMMTWRSAFSVFRQTMDSAVSKALPTLSNLISLVSDLVESNRDVLATGLANFFKAFTVALKVVITPLFLLVKGIVAVVGWLDKLTDGWASMLLILGVLIPVFTAWIVLMGVSAAMKIKAFVINTREAIGKMKLLVDIISKSNLVQRIANALTLKSVALKAADLIMWIKRTAVTIANNVATWAAVAAQWALNAALWASPITWVVAGILAIIAAIVLVIVFFEDIVDWLKKIGRFCKEVFNIAGEVLSAFGDYVTEFFGVIEDALVGFFDVIKTSAIKGIEVIEAVIIRIIRMFKNIAREIGIDKIFAAFIKGLAKFKNSFLVVGRTIKDFFAKLLNGVIDSINLVIKGLNHIPGVKIDAMTKVGAVPAKVNAGASNFADNSSRTIIINNNNNINTGASGGPAIANALNRSSDLQRSGLSRRGWN